MAGHLSMSVHYYIVARIREFCDVEVLGLDADFSHRGKNLHSYFCFDITFEGASTCKNRMSVALRSNEPTAMQ